MKKYNRQVTAAAFATLAGISAATVAPARADIFQWEYINPANPSQGKRPSMVLCPGGAGAYAIPGTDLSSRNLTKAYLIGADLSFYYDSIYDLYYPSNLTGVNLTQADLSNASLWGATLTGANLSQANLRGASFWSATLTAANFSGAEVQGANFSIDGGYFGGSGITPAQLYSTASYQAHDLTGIKVEVNNLAGVNLASQNLTDAGLAFAMLTGSDLSQANLTRADFYYASLGNASFSQANLTNADLGNATLTGANLSGAQVLGASFAKTEYVGSGIALAQLYSTASYQAHDLSGIGLPYNNLTGANFVGQNLANAKVYFATLTSANLSQANLSDANFGESELTNANFSQANLTNAVLSNSTVTGAILTGADVRGANFSNFHEGNVSLTAAQLYSTASYQAHDLTGIKLAYDHLAGVNLVGQNLTNASFGYATLTNANFSQAILTNAYFGFTNANGANFSQTDLTDLRFDGARLSNANFSQANLTGAILYGAALTGANLTGADVRGVNFHRGTQSPDPNQGTGITKSQLYSTASYQAHDLTGVDLSGSSLPGVILTGQNLTNAHFDSINGDYVTNLSGADLSQANLTNASLVGSTLTNANFSQANLTNANLRYAAVTGANFANAQVGGAFLSLITPAQLYSMASYQAHDLSGIGLESSNLAGVNFTSQNLTNASVIGLLTNANFSQANLTGANVGGIMTGASFTGAQVPGASLSGITPAQLYSTASYQAHNMTGIWLNGDLSHVNLAGQNLTNARFDSMNGSSVANLSGADLSQANLTNANFSASWYLDFGADLSGANLSHANLTNASFWNATLANANLTGADTRGALNLDVPPSAITANLIQPDGHIVWLNLTAGASLVGRDYDGSPAASPPTGPLPIVVDQAMTMNSTGVLRMEFDADAWNSTISFAPGIPVTLGGGVLDLTFAAGVDPATQGGRTFDLFDWTGVTRSGLFTVANSGAWNLSQLYTTGEITFGAAATPSWNVDAGGNWSVATNWTGGAPNGIDAIANFGAAITSPRTVTVDVPRTVGTINFSSPVAYTIAGSSAITLDVSTGQAAINATSGSHTISAPLLLNDTTAVSVAAGQTLSVRHVRRAPAATAGLAVNSGTLRVLSGAGPNDPAGTSVVSTLTIASEASLDLTNNSAVIDYTGAVGTLVGDVRQQLQSGRLTSSSADATHRLGYGDNVLLSKASFGGVTVDPSSILIKYTFGGDANLDGQVDVTDLGALATNWQTSSVWTGGDFSYDGFVNVTDLGMLATNWQAGTSFPLGPSFADALSQLGLPVSVPEPGIVPLAMLVCVAGSILNRSRARWSQIKESR